MAVRILVLSTAVKKSVLSQCIVRCLMEGGHHVTHPQTMDVNSSLRDYEHVVVMLEECNGPSLTKMLAFRSISEKRHSIVLDPSFDSRWALSPHANLVYDADLKNANKHHWTSILSALETIELEPTGLEPAFGWKRESWDPTPWAPTDSWDLISLKRGVDGLIGSPSSVEDILRARAIQDTSCLPPWSWRLVAAAHLGVAYFGDEEYFPESGFDSYKVPWNCDLNYQQVAMDQLDEFRSWARLSDEESCEQLTQMLLKDARQEAAL